MIYGISRRLVLNIKPYYLSIQEYQVFKSKSPKYIIWYILTAGFISLIVYCTFIFKIIILDFGFFQNGLCSVTVKQHYCMYGIKGYTGINVLRVEKR